MNQPQQKTIRFTTSKVKTKGLTKDKKDHLIAMERLCIKDQLNCLDVETEEKGGYTYLTCII